MMAPSAIGPIYSQVSLWSSGSSRYQGGPRPRNTHNRCGYQDRNLQASEASLQPNE